MKTAATGDVQWIELPKNVGAEGAARLVLALKSENAKDTVRVCLDLTDGGLMYLADHVNQLCQRRAAAHDEAARKLRVRA